MIYITTVKGCRYDEPDVELLFFVEAANEEEAHVKVAHLQKVRTLDKVHSIEVKS